MFNFVNLHQQDAFSGNSQIPPFCKQVIVHPQITETYSFKEPNAIVIQQIGSEQVDSNIPPIVENTSSFTCKNNQKLEEKEKSKKTSVDTSIFTIEERLISAVWVHERERNRNSIGQIKRDFKQRFNKNPPTKNTLLAWEKKLFSTGNVRDADRSGRPCVRKDHIEAVQASVASSPELSLRARAVALCLPRTTLRKILHDDLKVDKQTKKRNELSGVVKRKSKAKGLPKKGNKKLKEMHNVGQSKHPEVTLNQETHEQLHNQDHTNYRSYSDISVPTHQYATYTYDSSDMKHANHSNMTPIPYQQYVVTNNMQTHHMQ